jgi:periplasmic protein TonB
MAGRPLPVTALKPLLGAAALAVGLHLVALAAWPGSGGLRGAASQVNPVRMPSVQARWLTLRSSPGQPPEAPAIIAATAAPKLRRVDAQAPGAAAAPVMADAPLPRPDRARSPTTPATDSTQQAAATSTAADEAGDEEYLPRHQLTRAPRTDVVLIPYPEHAPAGRWDLRLTVFIDETGQVQRVRSSGAAEEAELPPELLDAAVQAFMATRYAPGERQGLAVKSRIEIAVEFRAEEPPRSADGS